MSGLVLPMRRSVPIAEIPDLAAVVRALGFQTEEDAARLDALADATWVLVRNDGNERWRCKECNGRHEFFTRLCIPRPWKGLTHGLLAYYRNVGAANMADLTPLQRKRVAAIAPHLSGQETLAESHPETARKLATPENDVDFIGLVLGSIEPITPLQASVYIERINGRARRPLLAF